MKFEKPQWNKSAENAKTEGIELERKQSVDEAATKFRLTTSDLNTFSGQRKDGGVETRSGKVGDHVISAVKSRDGFRCKIGERDISGEEAEVVYNFLGRAMAARDAINAGAINSTFEEIDKQFSEDSAVSDIMSKALASAGKASTLEKKAVPKQNISKELIDAAAQRFPQYELGKVQAHARSPVEQIGVYNRSTGEHVGDIASNGSGFRFNVENLIYKLTAISEGRSGW